MPDDTDQITGPEAVPGPLLEGDVDVSPLGTRTTVTPQDALLMRGPITRPPGTYPSPALPPWIPTAQQEAERKQQEDLDWQMQQMQNQFRALPFDQSQRATTAAMKFQGQRGYQADLAAGKPAHEAMAKWAPMLFYDRPQAFGGAIRQSFMTPRPAPRWVPADPTTGAPGHFESATGTIHVPGVAKSPGPERLDQLTAFDLHSKAGAITAAQRALSAAVASGNDEAAADARKVLKSATDDYNEFRKGLTKPPAGTPPSPGTIAAPPGAPRTQTAAPLPLPKIKSDLVVGQNYITRHGTYSWDGTNLRRAR